MWVVKTQPPQAWDESMHLAELIGGDCIDSHKSRHSIWLLA
jgi:hypothetical protein